MEKTNRIEMKTGSTTREGQDLDAERKDEEEVRGLRIRIGNRMRVSLLEEGNE